METIEQLQQDNAKLQERLNNAAKFFREQKEQIEKLSKENDELKHDAECFNSLQEGYENTIKSKDQAFKTLQDTYNEVFAENKKLKEQLNNADEYNELKKLHDEDLKNYNVLEDHYENLQNKYKELQDELAKLNNKYNDTKIELEKSLMNEAKLNSDNDILRKSDKEYREAYAQQKKENKETEEQYNKVLTSYEKDLNESKEKLSDVSKQYDVLETQYKSLKEDNNVLKEKYNNLNKLYDDLENEKLSYEADYNNIKEKYDEITSEGNINKDYIDHLETTISDIWVLCNNLINQEPEKIESKEIPNKNKVQKNSTGNQFMVDADGMNI